MRNWRMGLALAGAATLAAACAASPPGPVRRADAASGPVTCRDVLPEGTNVITTLCYDEAGWQRYERERRQSAQELLRRLQGGYGGF